MTYKPHPTTVEGKRTSVEVNDESLRSLMSDILKELKKLNISVALMTDEEITNEEIE